MSEESIVTTADGVMPGVVPASPRPVTATPDLPPAPAAPDARFTAEDIARAREQEKSKVYGRLESMQEQVERLSQDLESRSAAAEAERLAAEAAEKARVESETDVRDLLKQREIEWEQKFASLEAEKQTERALREKETAYNQFLSDRQSAIDAAADDILPELLDFVSGNNLVEIETSIAGLRDRSTQIMNNTAEALASVRRDQPGVKTTGLALAGPLDNQTGNQPITPEQIAGMSYAEYAANRGRLGVTGTQTGRGLFS
jgi:hypothetical protein